MYGHVFKMIQAAAKGVESAGVNAVIRKVPETLSQEVLEKMGALDAQKEQKDIPVCNVDELGEADGVIFGAPTRFGNMCGQMRQFLDATGQLWMKGSLVGKPAAVITSSNTQHGGQESTILSFYLTLIHHGMIIVGLPYTFGGQMTDDQICGGSPYGASTVAGASGSKVPSKIELAGAEFLGKRVAEIAVKLK